MLQPPSTAQLIEFPSSTVWFGEEGIVYSVSKKMPPATIEETKKVVEDFKKMLDGKKVCFLIDVTHSQATTPEVRNQCH